METSGTNLKLQHTNARQKNRFCIDFSLATATIQYTHVGVCRQFLHRNDRKWTRKCSTHTHKRTNYKLKLFWIFRAEKNCTESQLTHNTHGSMKKKLTWSRRKKHLRYMWMWHIHETNAVSIAYMAGKNRQGRKDRKAASEREMKRESARMWFGKKKSRWEMNWQTI